MANEVQRLNKSEMTKKTARSLLVLFLLGLFHLLFGVARDVPPQRVSLCVQHMPVRSMYSDANVEAPAKTSGFPKSRDV